MAQDGHELLGRRMLIAWLLLLAALLLIAANALFVAAEFSLVTVDRGSAERDQESGDGRAGSVVEALRSLSTQLSGAQLGITMSSLVVGFLTEPSLGRLLRGPLGLTGLPEAAVTGLAVTLALALATVVQMVLGELVPKNWALAEPMRVARVVAGPQRAFTTATAPLIRVLNGSANALLRLVGVEPQEELRSGRHPQELASLAARSGELGSLDRTTADMLGRAVSFGDRTARDVMTPRPQALFLRTDEPVSAVLTATATTGHARFPVVGSTVDDVVGVVHFKHVLSVPEADRERCTVGDVARPVALVPDTLSLDPLLQHLREPGWQLAVVIDEYGGTAGIVTLEDLVEEIVGEIDDEHDRRGPRARELEPGAWSASGLLRPDEVGRITRLLLPRSGDTETIGGLLQEHLGRIPAVGDEVLLQAQDADGVDEDGVPAVVTVAVQVSELDGRRVDRVLLRRVDDGDAGPPPDGPAS